MKKFYEQPMLKINTVSCVDIIATSMTLLGDEASRVKDIYDFTNRFGR